MISSNLVIDRPIDAHSEDEVKYALVLVIYRIVRPDEIEEKLGLSGNLMMQSDVSSDCESSDLTSVVPASLPAWVYNELFSKRDAFISSIRGLIHRLHRCHAFLDILRGEGSRIDFEIKICTDLPTFFWFHVEDLEKLRDLRIDLITTLFPYWEMATDEE